MSGVREPSAHLELGTRCSLVPAQCLETAAAEAPLKALARCWTGLPELMDTGRVFVMIISDTRASALLLQLSIVNLI